MHTIAEILKRRDFFLLCVQAIKSSQSCLILQWYFWDCYREVGGYLPSCWHQGCHKPSGEPSSVSVFQSREVQFYLLNMESVYFDTSDRSTDGSNLARCLSSWQGWDAPSRGVQRLCRLPVSSGRDPSLPSTPPGSNTSIHHSNSLVFSQGMEQYFAAIFLPPLVAVSQGWLCRNITDTGWRSGSNE